MSINLDWHQKDKYYIQSKCGYRVSHNITDSTYTAWTSLKTRSGHREIIRSGLSDVDAAKASCELHSIENNNKTITNDK